MHAQTANCMHTIVLHIRCLNNKKKQQHFGSHFAKILNFFWSQSFELVLAQVHDSEIRIPQRRVPLAKKIQCVSFIKRSQQTKIKIIAYIGGKI